MLGFGVEPSGRALQVGAQVKQFNHPINPQSNVIEGQAPVSQRESQVVKHRHGAVDHRVPEHMGNVSLCRRLASHVAVIEQHPSVARLDQPGDRLKQGCLAASFGANQGVNGAVRPLNIDFPYGVVRRFCGRGS